MTIPSNVLLLATHGSYQVPWYMLLFLTSSMKKDGKRLLKNFSDFASRYLIPQEIPDEQKVICSFSRALGDPNRDFESSGVFRDEDFNGNRIWKRKLPAGLKKYLLKKYYHAYHREIRMKIKALERKHKNIVIFDIHDTGNYLLHVNRAIDAKRKPAFPDVNLGNYDHQASSEKFLQRLSFRFEEVFHTKPELNEPYKGGYVTQKYGVGFPARDVVQIEFGRQLYMDERTQKIDKKKIEAVRRKLMDVLSSNRYV